MRLLELCSGIGGAGAALAPLGVETVGAVDINEVALSVYRENFRTPPHRLSVRSLESLSPAELAAFEADLWWISPPCQPYTRRGLQRDDQDPRAAGLLALLPRIAEVRPPRLGLENVPGFEASHCHRHLRQVLDDGGYQVRETLLCPTELGVPMRRRRFYLTASRESPPELPPEARETRETRETREEHAPQRRRPLASYLDPAADEDSELRVSEDLLRRYEGALDILDPEEVDPEEPAAVTACFTSAYGRSPVRSGSYLNRKSFVRRFSPGEILRLLGFPDTFRLPAGMPHRVAWRLVGNSLSLEAVRYCVRWLIKRD